MELLQESDKIQLYNKRKTDEHFQFSNVLAKEVFYFSEQILTTNGNIIC